ncbi:MAG: SDR family oxidoreductase [Halofilum sp. (in: g-proteobacteria)]|nr:SDR family oxidoreductase [Halofilum sp. (in: g-proteobacteria)]
MRVVVAGAHGQIAMLLHPLLIERGHEVRGLVRNPEHADELERSGVEPVVCDLEADDDVAARVGEADAIVFAAGAGPGSGAERKRTLDRDGALKLIEAAHTNGICRYVMVSAMNPERPRGNEVFRYYLQMKAEADAALRESGLDWTVVRPGRLTDEPGNGRVTAARELERSDLPRADVAAVLAEVLDMPETIGLQFNVVAGDTPVREALAALA